MIRIIPLQGDSSFGFYASGHSGSAPEGRDIVCSAVSALTQSAYLALKRYQIPCRFSRDEGKGILCVLAKRCREAQIIFESMYGGLNAISVQHPLHVRVLPFREVEK